MSSTGRDMPLSWQAIQEGSRPRCTNLGLPLFSRSGSAALCGGVGEAMPQPMHAGLYGHLGKHLWSHKRP